MGLPVSIILFIVLFFAILVSSVLIAHVVDVLQKKVNIGGPLIAGVMLAIVTSIPEIIICFIAAFDKDMGPSAVMGDVYGGLLLHTAALGIITLLFYKSFKAAKTTKVELINFGTLVVLYALYLLSVFSKSEAALWSFSVISIVCILFYGYNCYSMGKTAPEGVLLVPNKIHGKHGLGKLLRKIEGLGPKMLVFSFILLGAMVSVTAWLVTYPCDVMIDHIFNDSRATGGSIFLAIITSAPEVVSMFTLFKIGNIRGGISDIVGSSLFDCILLAIIEISYTSGKPFYSSPGDDVPLLVTVSLCAAIVSFIIIGLQRIFFKKRDTKLFNIIMISSLVIASLLYFVFICISIPGIEIKV